MLSSDAHDASEILLIEDNPGDARLLRELLKEGKFSPQVAVVNDSSTALRYLRRQPPFQEVRLPKLILLDWNLPKKHGGELLAEIKGDHTLKRIPVVVLTSSDAEQDVITAYDLHANCYVTKPLDFLQFTQVIHAILEFWLIIVRLAPS